MNNKKRKATIVTIYDQMPNIGNRLQNYAVQTVLEKLDFEVSTLSYQKSLLTRTMKIKAFAQRITNYSLPGNKKYWKLFPKRIHEFDKFNKSFIRTEQIKDISQIKAADYYVLGSDQVWNPTWYNEDRIKEELFLLTFAKPEQKICFSPSFGLNTLPAEWIKRFHDNLLQFPRLSVREEAGKKIIKELTGANATVTIDPTLMLDKSEWKVIEQKPNVINNERFILTYFIGGRSERVEEDLKSYASEINAKIYNLLDMEQEDLYVVSPVHFLWLIEHSSLVLTDSFHACVFSFLFGKPFLVYLREGTENNMFSRIDTLLKKFYLERKYVDSGLPNELFEADYSRGYKQLEFERKKTLDFLKKSMDIE